MHTARYAWEQERRLFCAALARGEEPIGEEDGGTRALLEAPGERLPELLPAWKRVSPDRLGREPVALPLQAVTVRESLRDEAVSPRLF